MPGAIFDLDGTLLDSNGLWAQVDDIFLNRHGLKKDADYIRAVTQMEYHASAAYVARKYKLDLTPEEVIQEWESLSLEAYQTSVPLKNGAREAMTRLTAAGYRLALVTLSPPLLYEAALGRYGLLDYFYLAMTVPDDYAEGKEPALFAHVCDQLALQPTDCLGFEDDLKALSSMAALGIRAYAVADRRNLALRDQYTSAGFVQRDWAAILADIDNYKLI